MAGLSSPKITNFLQQIPTRNLEAPWFANRSVQNNWTVCEQM